MYNENIFEKNIISFLTFQSTMLQIIICCLDANAIRDNSDFKMEVEIN